MPQDYINILIGVVASAGGWWLRIMWDAHSKLAEKVGNFEVHVANKYIPRDEVAGILSRIDHKLDAISLKLDSKADKHQ